MKIKEIMVEGVLDTVYGAATSVVKGIGKGVADAIAPGAVDKLKRLGYQKSELTKQTASQAPAPAIITKAMADLHQLATQSNNTVTIDQIAAILARYITHNDKDKLMGEVRYIGNRLVAAGVNVPEIVAAQTATAGAETGTSHIVQTGDTVKWNKKTGILTISGPAGVGTYKKARSGQWYDEDTREEIKGNRSAELQTELDKITGRVHVPTNTPAATPKPIQITSPDGSEVITKDPATGVWTTAAGDPITEPADIASLEAKAKQQAINAKQLALRNGTAT